MKKMISAAQNGIFCQERLQLKGKLRGVVIMSKSNHDKQTYHDTKMITWYLMLYI